MCFLSLNKVRYFRSLNNMETTRSETSTPPFLTLTISVSCSVISSLGMNRGPFSSSSFSSERGASFRNSSMSSGQSRLSSGSHVFSALWAHKSARLGGNLQSRREWLIVQQSHSLCEAFPLQEVLHSAVWHSAPDYLVHHKLLDLCSLLSLPRFSGLLLSHSAEMIGYKKKRTCIRLEKL